MLRILFLFVLLLYGTVSFSQVVDKEQVQDPDSLKRSATTVGYLQGGGGIVGIDYEYLLSNRIGIQGGIGLFSIGAGLNYHLRPEIRSPYVSLQIWRQGLIDDLYLQTLVGPHFVYRARRQLSAQLGIGYRASIGSNVFTLPDDPPFQVLYAIGYYF